jgi:hypothetical protein
MTSLEQTVDQRNTFSAIMDDNSGSDVDRLLSPRFLLVVNACELLVENGAVGNHV